MYDTLFFNHKHGTDLGTAAFSTQGASTTQSTHGLNGFFGSLDGGTPTAGIAGSESNPQPWLDASDNTAITNINIPT